MEQHKVGLTGWYRTPSLVWERRRLAQRGRDLFPQEGSGIVCVTDDPIPAIIVAFAVGVASSAIVAIVMDEIGSNPRWLRHAKQFAITLRCGRGGTISRLNSYTTLRQEC